jgi:tetratricopeptide (TPR) repeat protein
VNRRLLRIEERLDVRRVELTHDVLCPVVKGSRDRRHEREKAEAAERELAAQREREVATRKALVRARRIAAGSVALALIALAGAIFGWVNMQRAREAQAKAQETRVLAEKARSEAEKLIVYLLDDFSLELEPVGRLDIVASLSKRAIDYYAALPPELRSPESERTRALALVRYGYTQRYVNNLDEAQKALDEAVAVLKKLRADGDTSEAATIGLALGLSSRARVYDSQNDMVHAYPLAEEAVKTIEDAATKPGASVALRRAYGQVAIYMGFARFRASDPEEAVKWLDRSREAFRSIDGLKLGDLAAAAGFAEATAWKVDALNDLGRSADLAAAADEGIRISSAVLEKRPGHMGALRSRGLLYSGLASAELRELRPRPAVAHGEAAMRDWDALLKVDPGNAIAWTNYAASGGNAIFGLWVQGRSHDAFAVADAVTRKMPTDNERRFITASALSFGSGFAAVWAADVGDMPTSAQWLAELHRLTNIRYERAPKSGFFRLYWAEQVARFEYGIDEAKGDYEKMRQGAQASVARLKVVPVANEAQRRTVDPLLALANANVASACIYLHDYAAAEPAAREALRLQSALPIQNLDDQQAITFYQMLLAAALARQGRLPEARSTIEPALALHRRLMAQGTEDLTEHLSWATTLYVAALADPAQSAKYLAEAQKVVAAFPPEMAKRHSVAVVRGWIAAEKSKRS